MSHPLFNTDSSIKLLREDSSDYYIIKSYDLNVPLYQFAKGYRVTAIDRAINNYNNNIALSKAKSFCIMISSRLKMVGNRLKAYENKEIDSINPEIKKQFIDNHITSSNCFNASKNWEYTKKRCDIAQQKFRENKYKTNAQLSYEKYKQNLKK